MKAIVVATNGGSEVLQMNEVADPSLGPNDVLIQVMTTSVNFIDIMFRKGMQGYDRALPFIPGSEVSGIIEAVGTEVNDLKIGQRVMALSSTGSYAEKVVADRSKTFLIPDTIDLDQAGGMLMIGMTAYNIVNKVARIQKGDSVLLHAAAGGVGSIAVQLAKLQGAAKIIGTVGANKKISFVKDLGADEVINYNEVNFAEKVLEITDGKGVDVILDSIAGEIFELGMTCLANRGRMVIYSHASGQTGTILTNQLNGSGRSVSGYSSRNETPSEIQQTVSSLIKLIEEKKIQLPIDQVYHLSEAGEAHKRVESRQSMGKVLLKVI